ncbi:MAG TPA: ribosomal protein S18-alanine N-acetyltransferase [Thermoanaerobaculia bacterium]|nr:ribosomal protein S18-alanine N-acetyltransferase [Thermoanaerobaculia bacterium]
MPEGVSIRRARVADLDAIHALESVAFPAPWRREFFESEMAASGRICLVALRNKVLVGYLFAMWLFDEMHVNKIAVTEAERRKGIADALMAQCIDFAEQHDVKMISLEVRKSNHGAQEFYKHLQFKASYLRPRYYPDGEAAVVMTRDV